MYEKEPYVYCDPETMDDAILLFTDEREHKGRHRKLAGNPDSGRNREGGQKSLLLFYTSLYTMGVNAIQVHVGEEQKMIQLTEFVRRKDPEESKNGKVWVENPELHLTMLYYMQDLRRQPNQELRGIKRFTGRSARTSRRRPLYRAASRGKEMAFPLVKLKSGDIFQPIFG